jgi:uncharacterized protein
VVDADASAGRPEQQAGEFSSWLRQMRRVQRVKTAGMDVPCGTCIACCRASLFIHISPGETQTLARIPQALLFPAPGLPDGHVLMGYNERGECPMLQQGKCSIYEHRPQTCRDYDCRLFAATGITLNESALAEVAARARRWKFRYRGHAARGEHAAVRATADYLRNNRERFPKGTVPANATQLAVLAIKVYEVFLNRLQEPSDDRAARSRTPHADIVKAILQILENFESGTRER